MARNVKTCLKRALSKLKMSGTLLCKLIQRKTYDTLAKKHTLVLLFVGFIVIFVSTLKFGETLIDWSKEKYSVVFSPYNNNILGKNYRNMLCQYVPIDVVYTWVNGSDPSFLKELSKAKVDYGYFSPHTNCSFSNCVKSHMVLVRPQIPSSMTLSDLEEADSVFQDISGTFVVASELQNHENITVLIFPDTDTADKVVSKRVISLSGQNYTLSTAYITDHWGSQNTVLMSSIFILTQVPSGQSENDILEKLPLDIRPSVSRVFIHEAKSLAVLALLDPDALNSILKLNNITFENKVSSVSSAYLVIELPSDHEDISASRFTDNEELRYSLSSLEKHAPWVQHVYVITNGQIPYWLNLDNPKITIVTHEEIFPNKSHLPTFSSPAIECHLHRIPNLSQKFIYLNDDVMFGKDVWPEDFYTHTRGQKVYLSWPVPNCAEGCPSSWIRDGYCDKPCNNSQCQWDGGDCTSDNPMLSFQAVGIQQEGGVTSYFHMRASKNFCNTECSNTWLADRYCDKACNIRECGFDAGDCGLENFDKIPQLVLSEKQSHYYLPEGENVGFFNLTDYLSSNLSLTEGFYEENSVIRTLAISLKYSIIGIVLYPNHNATNLTVTLKGEFEEKPFERKFYLHVLTKPEFIHSSEIKNNATPNQTEESFIFEEFQENIKFPKVYSSAPNAASFSEFNNVNVSASGLPENITKEIEKLQKLKNAGILTATGFLKKKALIIYNYIIHLNSTDEEMPTLVTEIISEINLEPELSTTSVSSQMSDKRDFHQIYSTENISHLNFSQQLSDVKKLWANLDKIVDPELLRKQLGKTIPSTQVPRVPRMLQFPVAPLSDSKTPGALKGYFKQLQRGKFEKFYFQPTSGEKGPHLTFSPTQRHLLDTFGDSLRHVNKLYNEAFGFEARKVPSHIAHFVDKNVMSRLSERFDNAFEVTSSHKIRSSNDMQFAFSYYYYLMSEIESVEVAEIFDSFDVDKSGTWSDREIRTVLARLYDLPLDFSSVAGFEQLIINCSLSSSTPATTPVALPDEHYYESKLPLVSKSLIISCSPVSSVLIQHFGSRKRNGFEIVGEEEVAFKMIHNNLSQVLGQIDDLRKHPKKFVCLNDNMNHGSQEAEVIRAVIQDFYESFLPTRSQFELPPEYRNRFLYIWELKEWRGTRDVIRIITYLTLSILIIFSLISFWKSEMRTGERYPRLRAIQNRNRNSHV